MITYAGTHSSGIKAPIRSPLLYCMLVGADWQGVCVQHGYDADWLGDTFSRAVQLGNGFVAICAGLLANTLVETLALGPVAPFDAAATLLCVGGAVILLTWPENTGDASGGEHGLVSQLRSAATCIRSDPRIFLLGAMQVRLAHIEGHKLRVGMSACTA